MNDIIKTVEQELMKQEKYQALNKNLGITMKDFSIIKDKEYLQKATSGLNIYCAYIYDDNHIEFDFSDNIGF
jgi:hypothetical protein